MKREYNRKVKNSRQKVPIKKINSDKKFFNKNIK